VSKVECPCTACCREWNRLAQKTNRAQNVVKLLREQEVEMATIAWAKMYEALNRFEFFPRMEAPSKGGHAPILHDLPPANMREPAVVHKPSSALANTPDFRRKAGATVHLCEAPGAFIAATNHFLKTRVQYLDWHWRALTLNPYYEGADAAAMVEDDALIVQTKANWHFGKDRSGAHQVCTFRSASLLSVGSEPVQTVSRNP
jgi:cap2 methyltransferase